VSVPIDSRVSLHITRQVTCLVYWVEFCE